MYFDFEDYRPDIQPIGRAISWREGVLISIIVHLVMVIVLLAVPRLFPHDPNAARALALPAPERTEDAPRFVFVEPRVDLRALRPPDRGELSDMDRAARTRERPPQPTNPLPFSRGNSPERVESADQQAARGRGPQPEPAEGGQPAEQTPPHAENDPASQTKLPEAESALQLPSARPPAETNAGGRAMTPGGGLGEALKNLQRFVQRDMFDNPQGGGNGQFGPEIQFDTKGVEFGPWVRRFVAQVKRNWLIPYAAMSLKGHVVITFNVHKDGSITDLTIVGPCPIDAFNNAAYGALVASNPTQPLPPEYPSDRAFFTVTFFYNEVPPR
jgi:TonB family protein